MLLRCDEIACRARRPARRPPCAASLSSLTPYAPKSVATPTALEEARQPCGRPSQVAVENAGASTASRAASAPIARASTIGSVNEQAMPCGSPWRSVISYEIECASAVLVLENASPAFSAASAMRARSSGSDGASSNSGSVAITSCAAAMAQGVRDRVGVHVPDRLERVRQRIECALHRHRSRQRQHQLRVDDRGFGPGLRQMQRVLLACRALPDRCPRRNFAAGARRRRHGDQRS